MMPSLETLKLAPTQRPVAEFLRRRWSPRAFDPTRPISSEDLHTLFEAATWAPSSSNEQPWLFVYAHRNQAEFDKLLRCLNDTNQVWCQHAAVLVVALARTTFKASGKPNAWALHDVGAATTALLLQAAELGFQGHPMAGYSADKLREAITLPETIKPAAMVALGYVGDPAATLDDFNQERELKPRTRKPVNEIAFQGKVIE